MLIISTSTIIKRCYCCYYYYYTLIYVWWGCFCTFGSVFIIFLSRVEAALPKFYFFSDFFIVSSGRIFLSPVNSSAWWTAGWRGWGISVSKSDCSNNSYFHPTPSVPTTWTPQKVPKDKIISKKYSYSSLTLEANFASTFCNLLFQKYCWIQN